ncbi:ArsI/CadI family heavy metal resistance metalloenzyme [Kytococcus sp. Marseille-QA3725]
MTRVQIALTVSSVEDATTFYRHLLGTEPHKTRPGYANFAVTSPPLKLVLIEGAVSPRTSAPDGAPAPGDGGALNHLGIEVDSVEEVHAARERLRSAGLATFDEDDTTCCYARQDKVWVHDPDGTPWEVYTITDDDPADAAPPTSTPGAR